VTAGHPLELGNSVARQIARDRRTWRITYFGMLMVGAMLTLVAWRRAPGWISVAGALLLIVLGAWAVRPLVALHLTVFFILVGDSVTVRVRCPTASSVSDGTLKLRTRRNLRGTHRTIGTAAFQCPAGQKRTVTVFIRSTMRSLLRRDGGPISLNAFIVSLGLLWVMQAGAQIAFGIQDKAVPSAFSGVLRLGGVFISFERLAVTLCAVVLIVALYAFLEWTKTGRAMRATAQDADGAALQGVNIELVSMLGFALGCALAGASGALLAPIFSVGPWMGALPVVKAFIIIIVGGMGSLPGAVLGGLMLGVVEGVGTLFFSSAAVNMLGFLMVIAVLLLRPRGLLGGA